MRGGRGGVVREVREHSNVALAAVDFLSFPTPLLRLCWGSKNILRFSFPSHVLAVRWQHITILELSTTTLFTSPLFCPPYPLLSIPFSPQTSCSGSFQGQISLSGSAARKRKKKQCLYFFVLVFNERETFETWK